MLIRQCHRLLHCTKMTPSAHQRGAFIVFEGCDRSGKTTQCQKLVEHLNSVGVPTKFRRFPDRDTPIGQMISGYLKQEAELDDHVVHLLFSANRWEARAAMLEELNAGTTLLVDRYSYSGVAFSAAKQGMGFDWCKQPEVGLPEPDVVLYLTLSADEAAKRGSYGGERYEKPDFQKAVAKNYKKLCAPNWLEINADKSVEDLHEELKQVVQKILTKPRPHSPKTLWSNHGNDSILTNGSSPYSVLDKSDSCKVPLKQNHCDVTINDSDEPEVKRICVENESAKNDN